MCVYQDQYNACHILRALIALNYDLSILMTEGYREKAENHAAFRQPHKPHHHPSSLRPHNLYVASAT